MSLTAVSSEPEAQLDNYTPTLYANLAAVFAEGDPGSPEAEIGHRTDGAKLFYRSAVNVLVGAPESGKTLLALATIADELFNGGTAVVIDVDHNGPEATASRLRSFGVPEATLVDPARFRYASPGDSAEALELVAEVARWQPDVVLFDSVGEVMAMFGASSNVDTEYTAVHRQAFLPLATAGACVILIDHLPKSNHTAEYGAAGTTAKKRTIDGALYRVTLKTQFVPGQGGRATMSLLKDRHGSVRRRSISSGRGETVAATFYLHAGEATRWTFDPPKDGETLGDDKANRDLSDLESLTPPPHSVRDVAERMSWGKDRASAALRAFNAKHIFGANS